MISMIRTLARLAFVVLTITLCLPAASSRAQNFTFFYVSATGSGNACTLAQPCSTGANVLSLALAAAKGRIVCLSPVNLTNPSGSEGSNASNATLEMDCPLGTYLGGVFWTSIGSNNTVKIRNVTFTNLGFTTNAIQFFSSGTLILENCIFETTPGTLLDIEPNGPLNLVIRNSRISNGGAAGIILKPAAGGSINATFDHVTVTGNSGGGIRTDSTNGLISLDVTDSEVSNNTANGIIAIAGANQNMVSIKNSVIARNGQVGIAANGANAGVVAQTTLLDQNVAGATSVSGGHILTYQNNSIIGSAGSGFTGTASLQ
jgi:hypothetical protein